MISTHGSSVGAEALESRFSLPAQVGAQMSDADLEAAYPGLERLFDALVWKRCQPDWRAEFFTDYGEVNVSAGLLFPWRGNEDLIHNFGTFENRTNAGKNSLFHAEHNAIDAVLRFTKNKHLPKGSVLVSTVEPCTMCVSAFYHAGGEEMVSGATQGDMRGERVRVLGRSVEFRAEPPSYSAREFMASRVPDSLVFGGYRAQEAKSHVLYADVR
jgi:tRNA(Arg) A34 adenosine deaminase TadA